MTELSELDAARLLPRSGNGHRQRAGRPMNTVFNAHGACVRRHIRNLAGWEIDCVLVLPPVSAIPSARYSPEDAEGDRRRSSALVPRLVEDASLRPRE